MTTASVVFDIKVEFRESQAQSCSRAVESVRFGIYLNCHDKYVAWNNPLQGMGRGKGQTTLLPDIRVALYHAVVRGR